MMRLQILLLFIFLIPQVTYTGAEAKRFNLGAGYHSLEIYDVTDTYDGLELRGLLLSGVYMFTDNIALNGNYYTLNKNDLVSTDVGGTEILVRLGSGLATRGDKLYFSGGHFREQWDSATESNSFDGWQIGGGFGYNWEGSSFDMLLHLRDTGDYENYLAGSGEELATAGTLSLVFSIRF
jgi:hypothetical protein